MGYSNEPMMEMFIFETDQLIEQLETCILSSERQDCFTEPDINEIFRIMHTIKGSAAMMMFEELSLLAHSVEDLFFYLREDKPQCIDCSALSDLVLDSADFMKVEIAKLKNGDPADGVVSTLVENNEAFLGMLKENNPTTGDASSKAERPTPKRQYYISPSRDGALPPINTFKATIFFDEGCEMENIRAFAVVHDLKDIASEIFYLPEDIVHNNASAEIIRDQGFQIYLKTDLTYEDLHSLLMGTLFLKNLELTELRDVEEINRIFKQVIATPSVDKEIQMPAAQLMSTTQEIQSMSGQQSIISVSVNKLDKLMDLVGEMVIAEAMVIQNPDLRDLELDNFQKAARQLNKITTEVQDVVMDIRMVPLSMTFHKMHRIVRDMCRKLGKKIELEISGEETEVDKNIIEHISDPLMHLVRNAIDHGIESSGERQGKGKPIIGNISLEAKNSGSDVLITVCDDGKGLNKEQILAKAKENGLLRMPEEEMSDRDIFNLILLPGFSTKGDVSEYSGRGVGMDVVTSGIEAVGGSVAVDSVPDEGTTITLKIPLTLAIIDGMNLKVGNSRYTIPTVSIRESFRPAENDIITDPDGNEMIMMRGECYPILRLHEMYKVKTEITEFTEGIIIMVEQDEEAMGIFADELLGQQQVVIKSLPVYIKNFKRIRGIAGCTILGEGNISLILDVEGLLNL